MKEEEWRPIKGFPHYQVSDLGNVRRVHIDLRNHKLTNTDLKPYLNPRGYLSVSLCLDAKVKNVRVNRLVCQAFHGDPPTEKYHAAHNNGISTDNRAENLRWASPKENEKDKKRHGTVARGAAHGSVTRPESRPKGERHGLSKLKAENVLSIRSDNRAPSLIASDYGIHKDTVKQIKSRKTWRHV